MNDGKTPMLTSLHVQHYKSLADVKVDFSLITVLVGPNGSGKSNIVDALRFLRDAVMHGLEHAISTRGGVEVLRQYSPTKPYIISLRAEFQYFIGDTSHSGHYLLKVTSSKGDYCVEAEEGSWFENIDYFDEDAGKQVYAIGRVGFQRDKQGQVRIEGREDPEEISVTQLMAGRLASLSWDETPLTYLAEMRFSAIYPNTLREPSRPDLDKHLKENCANWASVLKTMRQRKGGEQSLRRINELMRHVMPGFEYVSVKGVGGYLVPQFLVKDRVSAKKGHYFDPIQLSDGTLRFFGLLLGLYQVPAPDFLAIEEPEQTIHPGLLGLLVEAFHEVSQQTQLLVTTHSPHLLDYFKPEEIRVVTLDGGETRISPIRHSQIKTVQQGLMSLSEIMALDGLRPEEVV